MSYYYRSQYCEIYYEEIPKSKTPDPIVEYLTVLHYSLHFTVQILN